MGWYKPRFLQSLKAVSPDAFVPDPSLLPSQTEPLFEMLGEDLILLQALPTVEAFDLASHTHQSPFCSKITSFSSLATSDPTKRVYSVKLDVSRLTQWDWMPGDAFGILPRNDPEVVEYALQRLSLHPTQQISLKVIGKPGRESLAEFWMSFGRAVSIGELFTKYIDWSYFPKKACLAQLAVCCRDEQEQKDLLFLASKLGSPHYLKVAAERTTILDFLHTFTSCVPTLELLLRHLPLLHPRFYSICNSPLEGKGDIEFIFNTIEYEVDGLPRKGLCSAWIESQISTCGHLNLVPRPGPTVFRVPFPPTVPTVMICAGTGISPFIGSLRHYAASGLKSNLDTWLFYGFRTLEDLLFKREIDSYKDSGVLSSLSLSVSRQPELGYTKYVQDALQACKAEVWSKIQAGGRIFICGDELSMVKEVNATIVRMVAEYQQVSEKEAMQVCQQWAKEGRIVRDVWI